MRLRIEIEIVRYRRSRKVFFLRFFSLSFVCVYVCVHMFVYLCLHRWYSRGGDWSSQKLAVLWKVLKGEKHIENFSHFVILKLVLRFVSVIRLRGGQSNTQPATILLLLLSIQTHNRETTTTTTLSPCFSSYFFLLFVWLCERGKFTRTWQQQQVPLIFLSFSSSKKKWVE